MNRTCRALAAMSLAAAMAGVSSPQPSVAGPKPVAKVAHYASWCGFPMETGVQMYFCGPVAVNAVKSIGPEYLGATYVRAVASTTVTAQVKDSNGVVAQSRGVADQSHSVSAFSPTKRAFNGATSACFASKATEIKCGYLA